MALLKQSTAYTRLFKMISSSDHLSLKTAAAPVVNLSKAGAAFGAAAGAVTEIANGWYKVALTTADTGTLGDLAYYITGTGADDTDLADQVSVQIEADLATPTNITAGTITTVTNLTNAPTAGDLTATMKTSVTTAATAATPTIAAYTGNTPQTGDAYARLGAPAGASVSADVAAIKSDTGTTLTDINTGAGAIYTRLGAPAGASISADIAAAKTDTAAIKVQTDKLAFTVTNQVDANILSLVGDGTAATNLAKADRAVCRGTVTVGASTTSIPTSAFAPGVGAAGQFIGRTILFDATTATTALQGQASNITASTNSVTPTLTVTALTTAPSSGDTFSIV